MTVGGGLVASDGVDTKEKAALQRSPYDDASRQIKKGNKMLNSGPAASKCSSTFRDNVVARLAECAPTRARTSRVERCLNELQAMAQNFDGEWEVQPFGSFANGFCTSTSDLDVTCCQLDAPLKEGSQHHAVSVLREQFSPLLEQHPNFSVIEEIFGARVPILKLSFEGELDVDLSCHNARAMSNTRLLKAYSGIHSSALGLGVAVKLWAKAAMVCGASVCCLSSYAFTLLAIYFMQVHPDVSLPVLPTWIFEDTATNNDANEFVANARASWRCSLQLHELLACFFEFYATQFAWGDEVVSVRCGCRLSDGDQAFTKLRGRVHARLQIEDPFQVERNLNCVLGNAEEHQLCEAFRSAWATVQFGGTLVGLSPLHSGQPWSSSPCTQQKAENSSAVSLSSTSTGSTGVSSTSDDGDGAPPSAAVGVLEQVGKEQVASSSPAPARNRWSRRYNADVAIAQNYRRRSSPSSLPCLGNCANMN
mmetsp:Transcript_11645/g.31234  ORF Transcript_11645/g.31234 Transcript_11645/m.31234 type:complete len:479 (+) Transcript_11645:112-1548(+)